jgi:hypothetical protein
MWARFQAAELSEQGEAQLALQHEREKMARATGDFIRSALPGTEARTLHVLNIVFLPSSEPRHTQSISVIVLSDIFFKCNNALPQDNHTFSSSVQTPNKNKNKDTCIHLTHKPMHTSSFVWVFVSLLVSLLPPSHFPTFLNTCVFTILCFHHLAFSSSSVFIFVCFHCG